MFTVSLTEFGKPGPAKSDGIPPKAVIFGRHLPSTNGGDRGQTLAPVCHHAVINGTVVVCLTRGRRCVEVGAQLLINDLSNALKDQTQMKKPD